MITIERANGGLLGEHYISMAGEDIGIAQPYPAREIGLDAPCPAGKWTVSLYPRFRFSPDDLRAIARAVEQKACGDAPPTEASTLPKIKALLTEAPCTCTDADTGIGELPEHRPGNSNCYCNMAAALLKELP